MFFKVIEAGIVPAANNRQYQDPGAIDIRFFRKYPSCGILWRHIANAKAIHQYLTDNIYSLFVAGLEKSATKFIS